MAVAVHRQEREQLHTYTRQSSVLRECGQSNSWTPSCFQILYKPQWRSMTFFAYLGTLSSRNAGVDGVTLLSHDKERFFLGTNKSIKLHQ